MPIKSTVFSGSSRVLAINQLKKLKVQTKSLSESGARGVGRDLDAVSPAVTPSLKLVIGNS